VGKKEQTTKNGVKQYIHDDKRYEDSPYTEGA